MSMLKIRICALMLSICLLVLLPHLTATCRYSSSEFSGLIYWLERRLSPVLSSSIVVNLKLFEDLSSIIALKDRRFVSVSSSASSWTVEMKSEEASTCSISWILLYRASISGYLVDDYHQACNGMGKCVVVVKAENGSIAAFYNEDGFVSRGHSPSYSPNRNSFIACVKEDGRCVEIFHRNGKGTVTREIDLGAIWAHLAEVLERMSLPCLGREAFVLLNGCLRL
jgi:hypothetical protein